MRRCLAIALLAALASVLTGCEDAAENDGAATGPVEFPMPELAGDWSGEIEHEGRALEIALHADAFNPPTVAYTEINCGGIWAFESEALSNPPFIYFKERLDRGSGDECEGGGQVEIHPGEPCKDPRAEGVCGYRTLEYKFGRGEGVITEGVLRRTSTLEARRIFEKAGLDAGL